jgi:hypothetical protein
MYCVTVVWRARRRLRRCPLFRNSRIWYDCPNREPSRRRRLVFHGYTDGRPQYLQAHRFRLTFWLRTAQRRGHPR